MIHAWLTVDLEQMFQKMKNNNWDTTCLTDEEFTVWNAKGYPISNCNSDKCILTKDEVDYSRGDKINIIKERVENEIRLRVELLQKISKALQDLDVETIDQINNEFFTLQNYAVK